MVLAVVMDSLPGLFSLRRKMVQNDKNSILTNRQLNKKPLELYHEKENPSLLAKTSHSSIRQQSFIILTCRIKIPHRQDSAAQKQS